MATSVIFLVWQASWIFDLMIFFQKIQQLFFQKVLDMEIQLIRSILWVWHLKIGPKSKNYQKV